MWNIKWGVFIGVVMGIKYNCFDGNWVKMYLCLSDTFYVVYLDHADSRDAPVIITIGFGN